MWISSRKKWSLTEGLSSFPCTLFIHCIILRNQQREIEKLEREVAELQAQLDKASGGTLNFSEMTDDTVAVLRGQNVNFKIKGMEVSRIAW